MKKISIILGLLLILTACSSTQQKVVLEKDSEGAKTTITYHADGDVVYRQEVVYVIDSNYLSVTPDDVKSRLEETQNVYNNIKGTTYEYNMDEDGIVTEQISVDFKDLDVEAYQKLNSGNIDGDISKGVSLQRSVEYVKQQGFVEVKE
ncbi:MAG: DUF1307 domain-containing protein [Helcococcus sp.]|nr:DUF1307 domain-containing protein [Helcococcus sp.]